MTIVTATRPKTLRRIDSRFGPYERNPSMATPGRRFLPKPPPRRSPTTYGPPELVEEIDPAELAAFEAKFTRQRVNA